MRKIIAWLTGGKVVWLQDFDGDTHKRIAYKSGFGTMKARRMLGVTAILHADGSVSSPSYVHRWEYAD